MNHQIISSSPPEARALEHSKIPSTHLNKYIKDFAMQDNEDYDFASFFLNCPAASLLSERFLTILPECVAFKRLILKRFSV